MCNGRQVYYGLINKANGLLWWERRKEVDGITIEKPILSRDKQEVLDKQVKLQAKNADYTYTFVEFYTR